MLTRFTEWARKYGGLYSVSAPTYPCQHLRVDQGLFSQLKLGPSTAIVLTDVAAVKELMDKRSGTTADRPPLYIVDHMTGGLHMALGRYSLGSIVTELCDD
jgi:hypothetical protein